LNKEYFVPKMFKDSSEEYLKMMRVYSLQDFNSFPTTFMGKFAIKEPPNNYGSNPREIASILS
jgi:hypothetical protein